MCTKISEKIMTDLESTPRNKSSSVNAGSNCFSLDLFIIKSRAFVTSKTLFLIPFHFMRLPSETNNSSRFPLSDLLLLLLPAPMVNESQKILPNTNKVNFISHFSLYLEFNLRSLSDEWEIKKSTKIEIKNGKNIQRKKSFITGDDTAENRIVQI